MTRLLPALLAAVVCGCAKPRVCGKVVRLDSFHTDFGPRAYLAVMDSSGTLHQRNAWGLFAVGDAVCVP